VLRRQAIVDGQGATAGGPAELGDHPAMEVVPSQGPAAAVQVEDDRPGRRAGRDQPFARHFIGHDELDRDIRRRLEEPLAPPQHRAESFHRRLPIDEGLA
jgi:hypothetical protein